ncbi:hypothetical protein CANARDRAFT_29762 [[Candida] arabinofermentans NRRL YB-2248]|uniref:Ras-GEF domain-containing protein n=1 Tax=[Candida] arabinofermentans NRRL YB-2248 TaxID=983967 RepID=A0A1E4SWA9_9ASCO|nr:hypothetical protein CANARDRAFT_29762 [[Candida] arabinofermentans NRRL YB-2248]
MESTPDLDSVVNAPDQPLEDVSNPDSNMLEYSPLIDNFTKNEPIFDNELLFPTPRESEITHFENGSLNSATIESIITHLSSPEIIDYQFLVDFFLTFREYIDSLPLLELILCRLIWCLRAASSTDDTNKAKIGNLALVRTFVLLRHWLLNHFQDDFINNCQLRQLFTEAINGIVKYPIFISSTDSLQTKVIVDLKKIYIRLCNVYWSTTSLERLGNVDILTYDIPAYESISSSRLSILGLKQLRNPSARRSGILSMVEKRSSDATNLLLQEHAEATKGNNILETILRSKSNKNAKQLNSDKFILHPKGSLVSLEANKPPSENIRRLSTLDNLYNNILEDVRATPIQGVKTISDPHYDENKENGFALNGKVDVFSDSKINTIVPNTPTKKVKKSTPAIQKSTKPEMSQHPLKSNSDLKTKKKKNFLMSIFHSKEQQSTTSKKTPTQKAAQPNIEKTASEDAEEEKIIISDDKLDLLSSRVITEYQNLMADSPSFRKRLSRQLLNNSSKQSVLSICLNLNELHEMTEDYTHDSPSKVAPKRKDDTLDSTELLNNFNNKLHQVDDLEPKTDLHDITDLNSFRDDCSDPDTDAMIQAINRVSAPSFKSPSVTMNWSNSLDVSNSGNGIEDIAQNEGDNDSDPITQEEVDLISVLTGNSNLSATAQQDVIITTEISTCVDASSDNADVLAVKSRSAVSENADEQHDQDIKLPTDSVGASEGQEVRDISLMSSSEEDEYDDSEDDGDIAEIPTDFRSSINGNGDQNLDLQNRFSINIISRNSHISTKSYMTYDSGLSFESKRYSRNFSKMDNKLRKKGSFGDLRIVSPPDNTRSPVYETDTENEDGEIYFDSLNGEEKKNISSESILNFEEPILLRELPFYDDSNNDEHDDLDQASATPEAMMTNRDTIDSFKSGDSTVSMIPSPTVSYLLPYPGISQTAIAELAAIPDERFGNDPISHALCKLKGGSSCFLPQVEIGLNDEQSRSEANIHEEDESDGDFNNLLLEDDNRSSLIDEMKLENKVRDLFISRNPNEVAIENRLQRKETARSSKFEISILSTTPKKALNVGKSMSIEEAMYKGNHIPFILSYESETLAEQFTMIERDSLLEIDWKELIHLKWDTAMNPYNSWLRLLLDRHDKHGLNIITLRFNLMTNWTVSEILLSKDPNVRVKTISRFIRIAHKCKNLQNYATMYQIVLALNTNIIKNLKMTWKKLDVADLLLYKNLRDLTSPDKNFLNFRNELDHVKATKGIIPFLALDLSDLTVNSEKPTIVKDINKEKAGLTDDEDEIEKEKEDVDEDDEYELINIEKFRVSCSILKKILRFIEWSKLYDFKIDQDLLSKCLYISSLSEEEMHYCFDNLVEA